MVLCGPSSSIPSLAPVSAGFSSRHFRFLVVLFVFSFLVVLICELISTMGKTSSKPRASLDLALSHFQDVKDAAAVSTTHVAQGRLRVLCSLEWPAFQVGWPPKDSFDLKLIPKIQDIVFSDPGHPDQVPTFWPGTASWSTPCPGCNLLFFPQEMKMLFFLSSQGNQRKT